MANRKRGVFSLPEELRTTEKLSTKKELAQRKSVQCPPVPNKVRKSLTRNLYIKPKTVCYNDTVSLSPLYNTRYPTPYLEQVYVTHGKLGEGSFGYVYKVRSKEDNQLYAIKGLKSCISIQDRYAEVRNNEKIGVHPNCVQYFMAWEENCQVFIQLEYCEMSLADYATKNNDIPEELLWNVLYDICKALNYLHSKNLLHLDVKPGNIMMKNGHYKLGDFGLLVDLKLAPVVSKSTLSDGDSKYLALEVLEGIYTPSCDIFGLGISLLELAADLELPDHGPLWQQLRRYVLPQNFYDRVSLGFKVIVERMLSPQHEQRPSAEKILKYKNVKEVEKRDLKSARTDFAAQYINNNDNKIDIVPLLNNPFLINNNYENPSILQEDGSYRKIHANDVLSGRKSLQFHSLEDESPKSFQRNERFSPILIPMDDTLETTVKTFTYRSSDDSLLLDNSLLSTTGKEISMNVDNDSLLMNAGHHKSNVSGTRSSCGGQLFFNDSGIHTSTPVLKLRSSNIRKMPKAKLTFD